ncbi:hypothetical protein Desaci_1406 [Desulfosporosinus acidiphilus SJ4]|uniref:GRAM domain-containing protein n=1 Tax=Desulfosporosinus acidiphilus (strain DSM 22704 / JCM 16185 / SJ4) TaxID=646529 RepID=I4D3Q5_DESAJ|nr:GRAM domain-containing protein [Desulfosporosinus acidiphilus]AFM40429.1 hypothetical protein Desaci_1406 [Desulfosporosinus acidiphilus SJ4]
MENGKIEDDETLLLERSLFNYRINMFVAINGKLKITDKTVIWYNKKHNYRIPLEKITSIEQRNFLFLIKTGIRIKTQGMKKKNLSFVSFPSERDDIIKVVKSEMNIINAIDLHSLG